MADLRTEATKLKENIYKAVSGALNGVCADMTKDSVSKAVFEKVYSAWNPSFYPRRGMSGGLGDPETVEVDVKGRALNYTFTAKQEVPTGPAPSLDPVSDITGIIESGGYGPMYSPVPGARPYMDRAEEMYWGSGAGERDIEAEIRAKIG